MPSFTLLPCRHRGGKFVARRESEPVELELQALVEKFGINPSLPRDMQKICMLQPNAYVGTTRTSKGGRNSFVLRNHDRSSNFAWVHKQDPTFEGRIVEVYRVDRAEWDSSLTEVEDRS